MESDDNYQSLSPPSEASPQVQHRRFKRLRKKATQAPINPSPDSVDDILPFPRVDFSELEALEASEIKTLDSLYDDSNESSNPLPDSVDDLLPVPRVDFGKLEAEEASETRNLDSRFDDSEEPGNSEPDSVEDFLPIPRVDFAKLEDEEAAETRKLDSRFDDSEEPGNPGSDSVDDLLPIPRVDFAKLEAEEAAETRKLDSRCDDPEPDSVDDLLPIPRVDFANLEALEASLTKSSDFPADYSNEPSLSQNSSGHGNEMEGEKREDEENTLQIGDTLAFREDRKGTKRALEFDDVNQRKEALKLEISGKKQKTDCLSHGEEDGEAKKKKNKRIKRDNGDDLKSKAPASKKRTQEKERKAYLKQLHAESQRLLRETVHASFKPIPVVNKPISSILEKIRKRKLEVSKKIVKQNSIASISENDGDLEDAVLGTESVNASVEKKEDKLVKAVNEHGILNQVDGHSAKSLDVGNTKESTSPPRCGNFPTIMESDENLTTMFRPPIEDTQDLFGDTETRENGAKLPVDDLDSPMEEALAPSLLATNLKFDSVPSNDSSSEEENDKENMDPISQRREDDCPSPRGDPVKAFVDEEAEEEDDSDNDLLRFKDTEEDGNLEDSEELNDIIATEYEEKPIDNEMRNELHQKWLQQQDAAGTDNLLQKLKVSSKLRETSPHALENDDCEDEEHNDFDEEDELRYPTRINLKKAKQIISQMFLGKDEVFSSDEDEETGKKIVKNRLVRAEEQAALVPPVEDEGSREVFGLIKKLNVAPQIRRKAKPSSYFDSVLKGGDDKCSSKSSFLGRSSNHHLPSSHKKGSTTFRSFIFGRDDSNSRSSISTSDECADTSSKEKQPIRTVTAKFTSSQAKFSSSQYRKASAEIASGTSLFEILKRSSEQPSICNSDDPFDLTHVISTFKIPKKPTKLRLQGEANKIDGLNLL